MELEQILASLWEANPYKLILSNPLQKQNPYQKMVIHCLDTCWQVEKYTQKQVFHENQSKEEIQAFVLDALQTQFKQCNAWNGEREYSIRISKQGKISMQKKKTTQAPKIKTSHNRKKQYILEEGMVIPPLVDMGIFTKEGKVVRSMYDKYKQINRFVELIDDEIDQLPKDRTLTVIDFGCGKSYLTFILYYYLVELKKLKVRIIGLDLKEDVIAHCNEAAKKYGYEQLHFELGNINGYQCPYPVDMVISLHACDTATDYALYNAISWNAKLIFSVPCCQHELNQQIKSEELSIFHRYGIIQERMAALMTDAMRANLLIEQGYKTQVLEFVDLSHTPKNILLRAVKTNLPKKTREDARKEIEALKREFAFEQTLDKLLQKK